MKTANRKFRKFLMRSVRQGIYALRIVGKAGEWSLAVQRGENVFRILSTTFRTQADASFVALEKFGVKPRLLKKLAA